MNGKNYAQTFLMGARQLVTDSFEFSDDHQAAGFSRQQWNLLTSNKHWTRAERREVKNLLETACSISQEIAGIPPSTMPGEYVAAVICLFVHPCNRILASRRAPEAFDTLSASGLIGRPEEKPVLPSQMTALVLMFTAFGLDDLDRFPVDGQIERFVQEENMKENA